MYVTINSWTKHNRNDVKKPTWFALSNTITEDDDLYSLTGDEFKAWIHILSLASRAQNARVFINFDSAERKANIKKSVFESTIKKLVELQIVAVDVTCTLRERNEGVSLHNITIHNNICDLSDDNSQADEGVFDGKGKLTPQGLFEMWNDLAHPTLSRAMKLTSDRRSKIVARLREYPDPEFWKDAITQINTSKFCLGQVQITGNRSKPWTADFDWFIKPGTAIKLIEGKYNKS